MNNVSIYNGDIYGQIVSLKMNFMVSLFNKENKSILAQLDLGGWNVSLLL